MPLHFAGKIVGDERALLKGKGRLRVVSYSRIRYFGQPRSGRLPSLPPFLGSQGRCLPARSWDRPGESANESNLNPATSS